MRQQKYCLDTLDTLELQQHLDTQTLEKVSTKNFLKIYDKLRQRERNYKFHGLVGFYIRTRLMGGKVRVMFN